MTTHYWRVRTLRLLVAMALLAGCAAGEAYRGGGPADAYTNPLPRPCKALTRF